MPNIFEYQADKGIGLRPTEQGIDATVQSGRRIAGLYGQAADAIREGGNSIASGVQALGTAATDYVAHREISHGAPTFATETLAINNLWNEAIKGADPNDPAVAENFRQKVMEPRLEKFRESFVTEKGQQWAERHVDSLRTHMFEKTTADMATMAGQAVQLNLRQTVNALSNNVKGDPSSLDFALSTLEGSVGAIVDSSPALKGVAGNKVKTEVLQKAKEDVVKAAIFGAIQKNPEAGVKLAQDERYAPYINGMEVKQFEAFAKTEIRARRMDQQYADHLREKEEKKASDAALLKIEENLYSDNPTVTVRDVLDLAGQGKLTPQNREHAIGLIKRELKPETQAELSRQTAVDLLDQMRRPEGDPDRMTTMDPIYKAYTSGKLSRTDFAFLKQEYAEARTVEGEALNKTTERFINTMKEKILKPNALGQIDSSKYDQLYNFQFDIRQRIAKLRAAGQDPFTLFDPKSPNYFGSPENMGLYVNTLQDSMNNVVKQFNPKAANPSKSRVDQAREVMGR